MQGLAGDLALALLCMYNSTGLQLQVIDLHIESKECCIVSKVHNRSHFKPFILITLATLA